MGKVTFTAGRVSGFKCRPDKKQAFLWDAAAPGLGLRATPAGRPAYVFQSEFAGKSVRITIGNPSAWSIAHAQAKARELQRLIDEGTDPRTPKREALAAAQVQTERDAAQAAAAATVSEAWAAYLAERREHWGERHYLDHVAMARPGGEPVKRGNGFIQPGPLAVFMPQELRTVTPEAVEGWAAREVQTRPTRARLALRLLRAFMAWCKTDARFSAAVSDTNPATSRKAREKLGKAKPKTDALLKEQLPAWFAAVRALPAAPAAYLQGLLLTGARPGELLGLRWEDLNVQWRGVTLRDKVESKGGDDGTRQIPLTPYVHHLLAGLPRRNEWVFASTTKPSPIATPRWPHVDACRVAGIEHLTLHGLRRSFGSLSEWLELPAGVVAQIQGHKPSATAEKHYRVRPLDLLRLHHEKFEAWILEQAGVKFDASAEPGALRAVTA